MSKPPTLVSLLFLAALGSSAGAVTRFLIDTALRYLLPEATALMIAVMLVNIVGSGLIGWLAPLQGRRAALWKTGFCGGLTTFSLLTLETVNVAAQNGVLLAGCYVVTTLGLSILAAAICYRH